MVIWYLCICRTSILYVIHCKIHIYMLYIVCSVHIRGIAWPTICLVTTYPVSKHAIYMKAISWSCNNSLSRPRRWNNEYLLWGSNGSSMPLGQTYTCQTACSQFFWSKDFFHASKSLGLVRGSKAQLGDCSKASEREKCSGIAHSRIWHGLRVKTFLFHATRWRLLDTTVFSPKSSRNSRTTWVLPKHVEVSRIEAIGFHLEDGVNLGENKNKTIWASKVANHYLFFYAHLCKCPSPCFSSPILMEDHENSDEWNVSNIAKVSRFSYHVGYFEHSQLFRTMVAQVRSHTSNDSWKKLIFLPQIKKIKAREKARREQSLKDDACFLAGIPSTCHSQLRVLVDNLTQFPNFRRRNYLLGSCDLTQSTCQGPCLSCRVWILKTLITIANDERLPAAKWAPIYASRI